MERFVTLKLLYTSDAEILYWFMPQLLCKCDSALHSLLQSVYNSHSNYHILVMLNMLHRFLPHIFAVNSECQLIVQLMFDFQEKIRKEIWILHPITPKPGNWLQPLKHFLTALLCRFTRYSLSAKFVFPITYVSTHEKGEGISLC